MEGKKISGNAEHIYKSRILHHGTLLFDSELDKLHNAIQVTPGKYLDKAVHSVRSEVTNILPYLHEKIPVEEFMNHLFDGFINNTDPACQYHFSRSDLLNVNHLARQKYNTWEWIYGYSPKYRFENRLMLEGREISMMLTVKNGIIKSAAIAGDFFTVEQKKLLVDALVQQKHCEAHIRKTFVSIFLNQFNDDIIEGMIEGFF